MNALVIVNLVENDEVLDVCDKRKRRLDNAVERSEAVKLARSAQFKHPSAALFVHIQQPYMEEFAVCCLIAYGHIIGQNVDYNIAGNERVLFDDVAKQLEEKLMAKGQLKSDECVYTDKGHYHVDVLKMVLMKHHKLNLRLIEIQAGTTVTRIRELLTYVRDSKEDKTIVLMGTLILTVTKANLAPKHFGVVKTFSDGTPAVYLDGLFRYPVVVNEEVLGRFQEIGRIYLVVKAR